MISEKRPVTLAKIKTLFPNFSETLMVKEAARVSDRMDAFFEEYHAGVISAKTLNGELRIMKLAFDSLFDLFSDEMRNCVVSSWDVLDVIAAAKKQGITLTTEQAVTWWEDHGETFKQQLKERGREILDGMGFNPVLD